MLGAVNETMVREFYHEYKQNTIFENALFKLRDVLISINARDLNKFLGLPIDLESDFLDVSVEENLDFMGKTLCDDKNFEWGKRAFIRQSNLTKVSAFWHTFVCSNLVVSTNATELNRDKIKIVYALVTNKPINLGEVLIEQIEIFACASRLDKKLAFPGLITQLCLAKGVKRLEDDVLLSPLEKFSEKRMVSMTYKEKGRSSDTFRLFGESLDSSLVSSTPILPSWAIQLRNEFDELRKVNETSQRKIEELNARVVEQDLKIKELEGKTSTPKHYVRSTNRTTFLGGKSG